MVSRLTSDEAAIAKVKYEAPRINAMNINLLQAETSALIFKIHVITGWKFPEQLAHQEILSDQLFKKLQENYQNVSIAEIEYAFRTYCSEIKDWGKVMNLSLFDQVMNMYLAARQSISEYEHSLAEKFLDKPKPSEQELIYMKRELVEDLYQSFLQGKSSFKFYPENGIDILIADGWCDPELYKDFKEKAKINLNSSYNKTINQILEKMNYKEANEYQKRCESLEDEDNVEVKILAKKMALMFCFYKFRKAGYKNIYVREDLS